MKTNTDGCYCLRPFKISQAQKPRAGYFFDLRPTLDDYKRHGTTTLFAVLDVATGKVIGECTGRHRHHEFLLRIIDTSSPGSIWSNASSADHRRPIRRRVARSVAELKTAIETYLEQHYAEPKPFVWTAPSRLYPRDSCQEGDER
jgi:hypothetical protein